MTRTLKLLTLAVCLQLALASCGAGPTPSDAGATDAGGAEDAGVGGGGGAGGGTGGGAGGSTDAGGTDAGVTDAGAADAGITDAGSPFDEPVLMMLFDAQASFPDLIEVARTGLVSALPTSGPAGVSYWNAVGGVLNDENNAYLLLMHSATGSGSFVRVRIGTGAMTLLIPTLNFSAWDEAMAVSCDNPASSKCIRFLVHKRSNRTAAVIDFLVGADGGWVADQRDVVVGTAPDYAYWFRIETGGRGVGLQAFPSSIGMYSPGDGGVGMMRVHVSGSDAGMFERAGAALVTSNLGNVGADWAAPVPLGLNTDSVFFHGGPAGSGAGALARVAVGVNITVEATWPANSFARAQVVGASPTGTIGQALFYAADGGASMGRFQPNSAPAFVPGPNLTLDAGYELVVPIPYIP